jgi:hypothetical protein
MEIKKEVKTIQVDYLCPACGKGNLRPTGNTLFTYPASYQHICNNTTTCCYSETFDKKYPYLEYEFIKQ